jgi:hypothetical protein
MYIIKGHLIAFYRKLLLQCLALLLEVYISS